MEAASFKDFGELLLCAQLGKALERPLQHNKVWALSYLKSGLELKTEGSHQVLSRQRVTVCSGWLWLSRHLCKTWDCSHIPSSSVGQPVLQRFKALTR